MEYRVTVEKPVGDSMWRWQVDTWEAGKPGGQIAHHYAYSKGGAHIAANRAIAQHRKSGHAADVESYTVTEGVKDPSPMEIRGWILVLVSLAFALVGYIGDFPVMLTGGLICALLNFQGAMTNRRHGK